jgi:hypothetical protein
MKMAIRGVFLEAQRLLRLQRLSKQREARAEKPLFQLFFVK